MLALDAAPPHELKAPLEEKRTLLAAADAPTHAPFGLAAKIAISTIVIGILAAASVAFFMYRGSIDILVARGQQTLGSSVGLAASRITTQFDTAQRDALFLAQGSAVTDVTDALSSGDSASTDDVGVEILRDRLASFLTGLLDSRQGYYQVRLIGSTGKEIVAVTRMSDGPAARTADSQLRDRSARPYFAKTAALPPEAEYISDIELDPEGSTPPNRPTALVTTPVYDSAGHFAGIVAINLDLNNLFGVVEQTIGASKKYVVATGDGAYLANSLLSSGVGAATPGISRRLQDDMPGFGSLVDGNTASYAGAMEYQGENYLSFGQRSNFDTADPKRAVIVAALEPSGELLAATNQLRDKTILIALAAILTAGVLSLLLSRLVVSPLRGMTAAATAIAAGQRSVEMKDWTARKDETGDLARAVDTMVTEMGAREERLIVQAAELTRSNQELAQFAYVASHDLQEPLRMVSSYLELLAQRYEGKLDAEAHEFIGFAVDGATRMKRLINDLLSYSRAGSSPMKKTSTDIGGVLKTVLTTLAIHIEEMEAEVHVGPMPTAVIDPLQYGRIFQNLIENALKYHSSAKPVIRIDAEQIENVWRFSVADNGIGVDPVFQDKIFEIFRRLHGRDKYSGTGIGLAVTKLVVERHGGRIWVEAAPGGGSIFYFTLPESRRD